MMKRRSVVSRPLPLGTSSLELGAKLFRGLGDPARLALLRALTEGPRTAGELAAGLGLTPSNASNHLRCLLECGLVVFEADGRFNRYRLATPSLVYLLDAADQVLGVAGRAIADCLAYGPPSRRALRAPVQPAPPMVSLGRA